MSGPPALQLDLKHCMCTVCLLVLYMQTHCNLITEAFSLYEKHLHINDMAILTNFM